MKTKATPPLSRAKHTALARWAAEAREEWGIPKVAKLFLVTPRTVRRWLDAGLADYPGNGAIAAAKSGEDWAGRPRWGLCPGIVLMWVAEEVAAGRIQEPELLADIRKCYPQMAPKREALGWPPAERFSWQALVDAELTCQVAFVFWAFFMTANDRPFEECPFIWPTTDAAS